MNGPRPLLTAIICTRNRERFILACVESLLQQQADPESYEILVVNNGSTDGTGEILKPLVERGVIRVLDEPVAGLSRARNTGWRHALGEYVGYIDDDAVADSTWISAALEVFRSVTPGPGWVGGPIQLAWETARPAWVDDELAVPLGYLYWGNLPRPLIKAERLGGGNSFFPRAVLNKLGGFDERLGRGASGLLSGEETQLQYRIEQAGWGLYYHPKICIHHFVGRERTQPGWFYSRYFWGGVTDYVMARTLQGTASLSGAGGIESAVKEAGRGDQLFRFSKNTMLAMGLGMSSTKTIQARIYMAYVVGRLYGIVHWKRRMQTDGSN